MRSKLLFIFALLLMAAMGTWAQNTYNVTLADGTDDAANWSISPATATAGETVTIKYNGTKTVNSIKVVKKEAAVTEDYVEFNDGTNTVKVAKMNLGATTIAESASTCYGNYYAWGATTTSTNYISNNAPYYDSSEWEYTKYTSSDGLTTLEDGDEVVKANMPGWHLPTKAEFKTLYTACGGTGSYVSASSISSGASYAKGIYWVAGATSSITIGGDKYNVNGILFVQDANHHVFFPAAGEFYGPYTQDTSSLGYYWSSSLNTGSPDYAYYLYFTSDGVYPDADGGRYYGFTVRPFKD